ncbi:MAG: TlpA disulfide reductase family protein [Cyclobacteriaceae bacterium]
MTLRFSLALLCCALYFFSSGQTNKNLPDVSLENLSGESISIVSQIQPEGPTIISFWATWCKPCILELSEMHDLYEDWKDETNVKIIAVSIDDSRSSNKVKAFANGRGWDFDILLDKNSDLKRALNINNVPYTLIIDPSGEIVYERNGYIPGDEEIVYQRLLNQ